MSNFDSFEMSVNELTFRSVKYREVNEAVWLVSNENTLSSQVAEPALPAFCGLLCSKIIIRLTKLLFNFTKIDLAAQSCIGTYLLRIV